MPTDERARRLKIWHLMLVVAISPVLFAALYYTFILVMAVIWILSPREGPAFLPD